MSVPRCKKKKGGLNPSMKKAEAKFQRMLDDMELEATGNASKYAQLLIYYALQRKFGFGVKRISDVQAEIDKITAEMLKGHYDLDWVERHFENIGITIRI